MATQVTGATFRLAAQQGIGRAWFKAAAEDKRAGGYKKDGYLATVSLPGVYTPVPYNQGTVITHNPTQWFNPAMFSLQPIGTLGNSERGLLRGPGLTEWNFSLVKDTKVPYLGEAGSIQFRAEVFNLLNHTNFAMPSGGVFPGQAVRDPGPYSETFTSNAGQITATSTESRQIQFALKLVF